MQLTRYLQKIFGANAGSQELGKFGSLAAGSPEYATNPAEVQELANYLGGWYDAVVGSNSPAIQDRNAIDYLFSYQLAYLMQQGIPEWNTDTEYFTGQFVSSNSLIYISLTDNNQGNAVSDAANWKIFDPNEYSSAATYGAGDRVNYDGQKWISRQGSNTGNTPSLSSLFWRLDTGKIIGEYFMYPSSTVPDGALICNGATIPRSLYPDLFAVIGTSFGEGDGSTTFNLPKSQGQFLRFPDDGFGVDPDAGSRTAMATGGATGDNIGSVQGDATARPNSSFTGSTNTTGNHAHVSGPRSTSGNAGSTDTYGITTSGSNSPDALAKGTSTGTHSYLTNTTGNHSHSLSVTGGGDSETRPTNAYFGNLYIVY